MANYDSRNVVAVLGPVILTNGYAPEEFLSIEQTNNSYELQEGSTGEWCRTRRNDRGSVANVRLLGSSQINDAMSVLMQLDELTNAGVVPFMTKDINSLSLAAGLGWIMKPPVQAYGGSELPQREWPIQIVQPKFFIGGQLS